MDPTKVHKVHTPPVYDNHKQKMKSTMVIEDKLLNNAMNEIWKWWSEWRQRVLRPMTVDDWNLCIDEVEAIVNRYGRYNVVADLIQPFLTQLEERNRQSAAYPPYP